MRQIADGAGIAVSVVQYHFDDKEALFSSVIERRIAALNHDRLGKLDQAELGAPDEILRHLVPFAVGGFRALARETRTNAPHP